MAERLRILTWHVHGNYLYYLTQVPHDFWLVTDEARSPHHAGRSGSLPWGDNVHEARVEALGDLPFDVLLFQSRDAWEREQHALLSEAQRRLPRIYLEHDPPQQHPTDTRHWVDDPGVLLVHVTHFNALMWDAGRTPTRVIEHGVKPLAEARWHGELERGLVVVNNLERRGRRLGLDVFRAAEREVPLALAGMNSESVGARLCLGEVAHARLPATMAAHRFLFNPIRYTSLGLAVIEAMMIGLPIVGLATTELASVVRDGEHGCIDTRLDRLVDAMRRLLADRGLAAEWGAAARRAARERFAIERFVADWCAALREVAG
jgi:glycosyltransferase involved in cell wall biosynthesis